MGTLGSPTPVMYVIVTFLLSGAGSQLGWWGLSSGLGQSLGPSAQQSVGIEVEYDKFKDTTTVKTDLLNGDPFRMVALYQCEGDRLCRPPNVHLAFYKISEDLTYQNDPTVIFLLDEETRFRPDNVVPGREYSSGRWIEIVQVTVSPNQLDDMTQAEMVEYQIESTAGMLTPRQKLALHGLKQKIAAAEK